MLFRSCVCVCVCMCVCVHVCVKHVTSSEDRQDARDWSGDTPNDGNMAYLSKNGWDTDREPTNERAYFCYKGIYLNICRLYANDIPH